MKPLHQYDIIGFHGASGAGKSTIAGQLAFARGYAHMSFADPLRAMLGPLLHFAGVTDFDDAFFGPGKDKPIPALGMKTPRQLMKSLGTEWGREQVDPAVLINIVEERMLRLPAGSKVVIDDVRFPEEVEFIRKNNGVVIHIYGRATEGVNTGHISEQTVPTDGIYHNLGSKDTMFRWFKDALTPDREDLPSWIA